MNTLNICAATFFVLAFTTTLVVTQYLPIAILFAGATSVPLYLTGLVLRWFVRGLVK